MAIKREYSNKDAKELSKQVKEIIRSPKTLKREIRSIQKRIERNKDDVLQESYIAAISSMPVEKVNYDASRIRTSIFRRAGYTSVYSILQTTPQRLSMLKGISPEMAERAIRNAQSIASETRRKVRVCLRPDYVSPAYIQLVTSIACYLKAIELQAIANQMVQLFPDKVEKKIKQVKRSAKVIKWAMSSDSKKQESIDAYNSLKTILDTVTTETEAILSGVKILNSEEAWNDYIQNQQVYKNIVEGRYNEVYVPPRRIVISPISAPMSVPKKPEMDNQNVLNVATQDPVGSPHLQVGSVDEPSLPKSDDVFLKKDSLSDSSLSIQDTSDVIIGYPPQPLPDDLIDIDKEEDVEPEDLEPEITSEYLSDYPPSEDLDDTDEMTCSNCGLTIPASSKMCRYCGWKTN